MRPTPLMHTQVPARLDSLNHKKLLHNEDDSKADSTKAVHHAECIPSSFWKLVRFEGVSQIPKGPTPVVHALPHEAEHARSEATRFVTANCTEHKLKTANHTG